MSSNKSWESRIGSGERASEQSKALDKLAESFVQSISYDQRLYRHDIEGSIAHAAMLAAVGLIAESDRARIVEGLESIRRDIEAGTFAFDPAYEDIHMVIEKALIDRVGDPGLKLHTGRSRNDQVALDLLLWTIEATDRIVELLADAQRAFVRLAQKSRDIVMPSFTHLQRAQPILAAAEALAWATMFERDGRRLALLCGRGGANDDQPLGSGAIAGSSLPLDASIVREKLQLGTGPGSSIERTSSRDLAVDFVYGLSMIAMHLSRWAEQWIIYSTTEFSFLHIADRFTTGSSMMPQKRNPDMLELIRGRCGNVYGNLVSLLTTLKGLPLGYNRDLQEDKRHVFAAFDVICDSLAMAAAITDTASFIKENIEPTLDRGFLDATSLAEYFVTCGIPFRTAHQIVGKLVARCEKEGKTQLSELSLDAFRSAAEPGGQADKIGPDLYESLGAANVARRYRTQGAAGGKPLDQQLDQWATRLKM